VKVTSDKQCHTWRDTRLWTCLRTRSISREENAWLRNKRSVHFSFKEILSLTSPFRVSWNKLANFTSSLAKTYNIKIM